MKRRKDPVRESAPDRRAGPRESQPDAVVPAEQRSSERVPIGAPATIQWGETEFTGFVEVVNLAGAFVAATRNPDLGDYVNIVFNLPGDPRTFRVRANVVCTHCPSALNPQRSGFGARFERPTITLIEAIRGLGH